MPGKGVLNPRPGDGASRGDVLGHGAAGYAPTNWKCDQTRCDWPQATCGQRAFDAGQGNVRPPYSDSTTTSRSVDGR